MKTTATFFRTYHLGSLLYIFTIIALFAVTFTQWMPSYFVYIPLLLAFIPICFVAIKKLIEKKIETELFLTIATIISLVGHQEQAMTVVLLIMLFAHYLEDIITDKTDKAIKDLITLIPTTVLVKIDHEEKVMPITHVQKGMLVIVQTGGRIPVDGSIEHGVATINEASLTGESTPIEKKEHDRVFAGTFVEAGSVTIRVEKVGEDTFFGKIVDLVQRAEGKKAPLSLLTDTVAFYLVPALLIFIGFVWVITGNLTLVMTLLIFGSPLELTIIPPLTILSAIIAAFRNGILIKGGRALELFSYTDTIIFDKTGTLTMGEPTIVDITIFQPGYTTRDIIQIAAIAEKRAAHALAKAILKKAQEENIPVPDPEQYISTLGHGVEVIYDNKHWFLGNQHFVQAPEHGNIPIPEEITQKPERAHSCFYLGSSGKLYAKICSVDQIRSEAKETIANLYKLGVKDIKLVSGDKQHVVDEVCNALGIKQGMGGIFPDEKLTLIKTLQDKGHTIAMIGDGINDAPALHQANVGIAMGAMGMAPAIEAADIVLTTNDLDKISFMLALSKKGIQIIKQNIYFGFITIHLFGMALAFLQLLNPIQAAFFHAVPDILILLNSSRLTTFKFKGK